MMITSPTATAPLSNPSGSMITMEFSIVAAELVISAVAVMLAVMFAVIVAVGVLPVLATVVVELTDAKGSVSVAVVFVVSLISWAISTLVVSGRAVLAALVGVVVTWTTAVRASGSVVSSAATSAGAMRLAGKKASPCPNQPSPTLRIRRSTTAATGNSIMTDTPRRLRDSGLSTGATVGRHWLLCKKAVVNSLAFA